MDKNFPQWGQTEPTQCVGDPTRIRYIEDLFLRLEDVRCDLYTDPSLRAAARHVDCAVREGARVIEQLRM